MLRIDMLEEPEDEMDLIFKAQNVVEPKIDFDIYGFDYEVALLPYVIPVTFDDGSTLYVEKDFYDNLVDNVL